MNDVRNKVSFLGILLCAWACGGGDDGSDECPVGPPSFDLGEGQAGFRSLMSGQDLQLVRGSQGGCHFALAFVTRGFPGSRTLIRYEIVDRASGAAVITSRQFVKLRPSEAEAGACGLTNFIAFVPDALDVEDQTVEITVTIEEADASSTQRVDVVARWPDPVSGVERNLLCGSG